jgi:arginine:pyruvate transaminase
VHRRARALAAEGRDVIELTIGEPDLPVPAALIETAVDAMRAGRTGYADARGEPKLREAVSARYARLTGRPVAPDQVLCFPGAQTALYAVMQGIVGPGDEVLVADPHYATY